MPSSDLPLELPITRPSPWLGRGLCVLTAVLWSTSGLFIKHLTAHDGSHWPGIQVAAVRSLIAAATLFALGRPRRLRPTRHQWLLAGVMAPTLFTYVLAQTWTATANAVFLQYTGPLYVLLLAPLVLRERPTRRDMASMPIMLLGMFLILSSQLALGQSRLGDIMGLLSGIGFAGVILVTRKRPDTDALTGMAWGNVLVAAISFALTGLAPTAFGQATGLSRLAPHGFVAPDLRGTAEILWLGVFQLGVSYFVMQRALRLVPALEASLIFLLEAVLSPLWAYLMIADRPAGKALLGGGIILAALAGQAAWARFNEKKMQRELRRTAE